MHVCTSAFRKAARPLPVVPYLRIRYRVIGTESRVCEVVMGSVGTRGCTTGLRSVGECELCVQPLTRRAISCLCLLELAFGYTRTTNLCERAMVCAEWSGERWTKLRLQASHLEERSQNLLVRPRRVHEVVAEGGLLSANW